MEMKQNQLGYEELKQELEALQQSFYVTTAYPAQEALVLKEALEEISLQQRSKSLYYYELPGLRGKTEKCIIGVEAGRNEAFQDLWRQWQEKVRLCTEKEALSAALTELLEQVRQQFPEQIVFATELMDYLIAQYPFHGEIKWQPQSLNEHLCPVVLNEEIKRLQGQPGDLDLARGGYLLVDARRLYEEPQKWQQLHRQLAQKKDPVKIVLYGSAALYDLWRQEDEDFAAFFSEVRIFPSKVPNSWPNRQAWRLHIRETLDVVITDKALDFLLALIAGLDFQSMEDGSGFLPGRLEAAQPWLKECEWICREKNTELINIAIVKEVWENRRRRGYLLQQALPHAALANQSRKIGAVYSLMLCDGGYCKLCEPVRIVAKRRSAKRKKDEFDLFLECTQPVEEGALQLKAATALAVLSAMGGYEIRQAIAVIGGADESGCLTPAAEAEELIAGYYEMCRRQGCESGGVLLAAASMMSLKLPAEVQKALREKRFFLYPVRTLVEGAEILMKRI